MDDQAADIICKRAMVELVFLLAHQRQPKTRERRDWTLLRSLVRDALKTAPRPDQLQEGPWQVGQRPLQRPGRNGLRYVPLVARGRTEIMMPTAEEAENLVAFLNWCGMPEFGDR
ncbi:MAG TPA: hypothetical protein VMY76_12200 [Gemmatimonadales bacterium]|nr:hypothetical protein [Gemmatimonadales bacterium]